MEACRQSIKKYEKMEPKDLNELNSALSGCIWNKKQEDLTFIQNHFSQRTATATPPKCVTTFPCS